MGPSGGLGNDLVDDPEPDQILSRDFHVGRGLLRLPDADRPPVEHAGDGARRLSLQRLLAHGPAAGAGHHPCRGADAADRVAAVSVGGA